MAVLNQLKDWIADFLDHNKDMTASEIGHNQLVEQVGVLTKYFSPNLQILVCIISREKISSRDFWYFIRRFHQAKIFILLLFSKQNTFYCISPEF